MPVSSPSVLGSWYRVMLSETYKPLAYVTFMQRSLHWWVAVCSFAEYFAPSSRSNGSG